MSERPDPPTVVTFDAARLGAETLPWELVRSEYLARCRILNLRRDLSIDPRDGRQHDFYVIEAPDWVNVIPLTPDGQVVMIEQYRHGSGEVTLEIPGGMVDEGEEAHEAAVRELWEETGYRSGRISLLGKSRPNPAIQNNWLHAFLAEDCSFEQIPIFDGSEHTAVRLVPPGDIPQLIATGMINHALVIVAFHELSLQATQESGPGRTK